MPNRDRARRATSRRKPRQQRSKQTVDDILEATAQVLKREGVARTTTERVAARAGVSVGSLYQYFPNKVALYKALTTRHFDRLRDAAASAAERYASADVDALPDAVADIVLEVERLDPELSGALHQIAATTPEVEAIIHAASRASVAALTAYLTARRGEPGMRPDLDPVLAARVLMRALAGLVRATMEQEPALVESEAFGAELRELVRGYLLVASSSSSPSPSPSRDQT